jgi:putative addiction module component (TIGR02574 family)
MEINLLEEAKKLPFAEKMQLVEDLWDAIAAEAAMHRLSDAQKRVLEQRLLESQQNPDAGESWEVVRAEIERSL